MTTLIQSFTDIKPQRIEIGKFYTAIVVENNDKKNLKDKLPLGRVKFRIPVLFDDIDDEFLPWAVPKFQRYKAGKNNGEFTVPQKGAKIFVEFQSNDVYNPFYFGYPYVKEETLEILTKESVDDDEYPKKHVIYCFDSENVLTINDDYEDEELKFKLYLKNVGNVQIWCGKNYDHYVKDNFDLVVDSKFEVHSIPESTSVLILNPYIFTAHKEATLTYKETETKEVQGKSSHVYMDLATRMFGKGLILKVSKGEFLLDINSTSTAKVKSSGSLEVSSARDVAIKGTNITVEASNWLKLRGAKVTSNVDINYENGAKLKDLIRSIAKEEAAKVAKSSSSSSSSSSRSSSSSKVTTKISTKLSSSSGTKSSSSSLSSKSGSSSSKGMSLVNYRPRVFYI